MGSLGGDQEALLQALNVERVGDYAVVADVSGVTDASKSGQWGVRFTFAPESLPDTEFALYYANYHSSLPFIDAYISSAAGASGLGAVAASPVSDYLDAIALAAGGGAAGAIARGQAAVGIAGLSMLNNGAAARVVYPEDIKVWGASFNTKVWGYTQIAGELTYRENAPIWVDHPEDLLTKAIESLADSDPTNDFNSSQADPNRMGSTDTWNANYERTPMWDASLSVIQPFGAVLGTDLMYVVGEAAFQQVSGLDNYERYVAKGSSDWAGEDVSENADERLTRFSWGYNMMVGANWNDVAMPGLNLESTFRFTHDVDGNSHMTGRFEEGEKKINMGLTAKYDDMMAKVTWGGDADTVLRKGTITGRVGYTF